MNQQLILIIVTKYITINNYNNRNNVVNNGNSINNENKNLNISDSENNSTVANNVVNRSIGENLDNISNFLNNNFLLDGRAADIIDLNYEKEWDVLFNNQIISGDYSKKSFLVSVNAENAVRQTNREPMPLKKKGHNFFQIVNSNPNPEINQKSYNLEKNPKNEKSEINYSKRKNGIGYDIHIIDENFSSTLFLERFFFSVERSNKNDFFELWHKLSDKSAQYTIKEPDFEFRLENLNMAKEQAHELRTRIESVNSKTIY
ncbi:hypothetical protein H8356DRAFT_1339144 [Neocallimastix lanati (nom. inval.)]|nr:hypothetical protein H8356DRAFT_1339144 [Neocallimastix sp. JGI-2020a]